MGTLKEIRERRDADVARIDAEISQAFIDHQDDKVRQLETKRQEVLDRAMREEMQTQEYLDALAHLQNPTAVPGNHEQRLAVIIAASATMNTVALSAKMLGDAALHTLVNPGKPLRGADLSITRSLVGVDGVAPEPRSQQRPARKRADNQADQHG